MKFTKRLISISLSACIFMSGICVPSKVLPIKTTQLVALADQSGKCGDNASWSFDSNSGTLTITGTGTMIDYGSRFSEPHTPWEYDDIKKVIIEDGITAIGAGAFWGCADLETVVISNSVKTIGELAFGMCDSLKYVVIPDGVQNIGYGAFLECISLPNITVPETVNVLESHAFFGCKKMSAITIQNKECEIFNSKYTITNNADAYSGVIQGYSNSSAQTYAENYNRDFVALDANVVASGECGIDGDNLVWRLDSNGTLTLSGKGSMAKWYTSSDVPWDEYCSTIKKIVLPEGLTSIQFSAFSQCTNFTDITIPSTVTNIGDGVFDRCTSLTNISVSADNTAFCSVGGVLFNYDKTELISYPSGKADNVYSIPDGVVSIRAFAFSGSRNLISVSIPEGVTRTPSCCFSHCTALTNITFPKSFTTIGNQCFLDCKALETIIIPDTVTSISDSAFYNCSKLKSVTISKSVTNIGEGIFSRCFELTHIIVEGKNEKYCSDSGILFNKDKTKIIAYPAGIEKTYYQIPDGVETIEAMAFYGCSNLTEIIIPDTVTNIRRYAFYQCSCLTSITIPKNVSTIRESAFGYCTHLNKIVIENPICEIQDFSYDTYRPIPSNTAIYGYIGSTAQEYADKHNQTFINLNDASSTMTETTVATTTATTATTTTSKATTSTASTTATTTTTVAIQNDKKIVWNEDNYSFVNNDNNFHKDSYHLSDNMLSLLSQKANNMEWETISEKTSGVSKWNGSCYGMSAVEILTKIGLLDVKSISSTAKCLHDLNAPINDSNVEDVINYYHMLQYSTIFKTKAEKFMQKTNKTRISELISMASAVEKGGNPVLVCFNYSKTASKRLDSGHAVVAYGVEYGSWTYSKKYDCRILISDPNLSTFDNTACIYINTDTYHWEIPYYQNKCYSCSNSNQNNRDNPYAQVRLITNDEKLIDTYGYVRNANAFTTEEKSSTISINSISSDFGVGYYDASSGDLNDTECELVFYSGLMDSNTTNGEIEAILPASDVAYEYFEKSSKPFNTAVEYSNSKLRADVSKGNYAIYQPDKSVEFSGSSSDYTLSMILNEGYYPTDWYKIQVEGFNSNSAKLSVAQNGYIISGDALAEGIFISASNRAESAKLNLMTDAKSVLVYEINQNTIGVKLDKNGDGIYETKFAPNYVGDVNQDSQISVVDIVTLQKYLHAISTISREQYIAADLNLDGRVNVCDLAYLKKLLITH